MGLSMESEMPRKKTVDDAAVLAAFAELQNGRAVARKLGIHQNTIYQVIRRNMAECFRCKAPVTPGRRYCAKCAAYERDRIRLRRKKRMRLGLCQQCGKQRSPLSRLHCEEHRIAAAERNETYHDRRRVAKLAGSPHGGKASPEQRLRHIRDNYGPNGVACWLEAEGKCEVCGVPYGEAAVHIHHIDCDRANDARENYACLCFHCHKAVHQLLDARDRTRLIEWYSRTYPDKPLQRARASTTAASPDGASAQPTGV